MNSFGINRFSRQHEIIIAKRSFLFRYPGRNMRHEKDQSAFRNIRQIFFQPFECRIVYIADIEVFAPYIKIIVDDNIVGISFIERVVGRTKISFKSLIGRFVSSSVIIHIMIANRTINRNIQFLHLVNIGWKARCIPKDITAIQSEHITVLMQLNQLFIVIDNRSIQFPMLFLTGLHIRFQNKQMLIVILRILLQTEIIFIRLIQINLLIESGNRLFAIRQISGRSRNIYKARVAEIGQMINAVLIGSDATLSIRHYHIGYTFAIASNSTFDHSCFIHFVLIQCLF